MAPRFPHQDTAILFPTGSSGPLATTAAATDRCHIKINEAPGAGSWPPRTKDGLGWGESARHLCRGSIHVSHRLILSNFQVIPKFIKLAKTNLWKIELVTDRKPMIYCLEGNKCLQFHPSVC